MDVLCEGCSCRLNVETEFVFNQKDRDPNFRTGFSESRNPDPGFTKSGSATLVLTQNRIFLREEYTIMLFFWSVPLLSSQKRGTQQLMLVLMRLLLLRGKLKKNYLRLAFSNLSSVGSILGQGATFIAKFCWFLFTSYNPAFVGLNPLCLYCMWTS